MELCNVLFQESLLNFLLCWPLVCVLHEELICSFTDTMIREGNVAVQAREEEIRFMKMHAQEERRGIDVLRKALPNKRNLEQELVTLQIQVIYETKIENHLG